MKRIIALLLALILAVSALAACSSSDDDSVSSKDVQQSGKIQKSTESSSSKTEPTAAEKKENTDLSSDFNGRSDVAYVMVYNPDIYDENSKTNKTLSTGNLSKWIDTDVNRADGLTDDLTVTTLAQGSLNKDIEGMQVNEEGDRAGGLQPTYKTGDKHSFYYNEQLSSLADTKEKDFTCTYAGDHCYVWTLDSDNIKESDAKEIAKEFDNNIYQKDVDMFGKPRFASEGGKVSLLFHKIDKSCAGYFAPFDLYSSSEVTDAEAKHYQINRDHAIVHINSLYTGKSERESLYATIAHEFQHLICATAGFENTSGNYPATWLNEAMSGYAEETIYPGIQKEDSRYLMLEYSYLIRDGQSLYNFGDDGRDYGVYGSVFLFSEYLANKAGKTIYSDIQKYWRTKSTDKTDDAEAIYKSVSSSYSNEIDKLVDYPSAITFKTEAQKWMSKMTLDYYISLMQYDTSDPKEYKDLTPKNLLYDEVNAAKLEGGGRIIFATKDGKFEIPSDADRNLVYVGFDKNFEQITKPVCK